MISAFYVFRIKVSVFGIQDEQAPEQDGCGFYSKCPNIDESLYQWSGLFIRCANINWKTLLGSPCYYCCPPIPIYLLREHRISYGHGSVSILGRDRAEIQALEFTRNIFAIKVLRCQLVN